MLLTADVSMVIVGLFRWSARLAGWDIYKSRKTYALCLRPPGLGDGETPPGVAIMSIDRNYWYPSEPLLCFVSAQPEAQSLGVYLVGRARMSSASERGCVKVLSLEEEVRGI